MAWAFALELTRYRMRSVLAGESEICCGDAIDDQLRRRRSVQSCQTRCSQRSHPLVDVIGPALKTCREMKYLLLVACELTCRRCFAQLISDFSEVFGSRHHHRCPNARIPARTTAAPVRVASNAVCASSFRVGIRASCFMMATIRTALTISRPQNCERNAPNLLVQYPYMREPSVLRQAVETAWISVSSGGHSSSYWCQQGGDLHGRK